MSPRKPATVKLTVRDGGESGGGVTPSQELIRQALKESIETDETGRRLTLRQPGPLAQYRLIEALGDLAMNQAYMAMVTPLTYLSAIDGVPEPAPKSKLELEALITRLDQAGMDTIMKWYMLNVLGPAQDAMDAAKRAAEEKAAVKN